MDGEDSLLIRQDTTGYCSAVITTPADKHDTADGSNICRMTSVQAASLEHDLDLIERENAEHAIFYV